MNSASQKVGNPICPKCLTSHPVTWNCEMVFPDTRATRPADDGLGARLEELAAKATPGPWETDSEYDDDALYSGGGGCGTGFKNFFIGADVGGEWKTLLDTVNSDHKLIEEDFDEDGKNAWDSIGWANVELLIALRNNLPAILTALRAQSDAEVERIVAWLEDQAKGMAKAGDIGGGAKILLAAQAIERGEHRKDGV